MIGDRQSLPTAKNFMVTGRVLQESRQLVSSGGSIGEEAHFLIWLSHSGKATWFQP